MPLPLSTRLEEHYFLQTDVLRNISFEFQGTIAPPLKWEGTLKQNLALASRCAMIEQTPTENIAIIANVDKW